MFWAWWRVVLALQRRNLYQTMMAKPDTSQIPAGTAWLAEVKSYENAVLSKRA